MSALDRNAFDLQPLSAPDIPLYNIQAVAAATGVPTITLRSWERRYGVPAPRRDPKGYRLYSERDIEVVRWLREQVRHGVGISRAVNVFRALRTAEDTTREHQTFDPRDLRHRLLEDIFRLDEAGILTTITEVLAVMPVEDAVLEIFQATLYDVDESWAAGDLSVTCEHFAANIIRGALIQLLRLAPRPVRPERLIVGCGPGELHDIGALTVALLLRRRGFGVVFVGASVEEHGLVDDACRHRPSGVLLSASTAETAVALAGLASRLADRFDGLVGIGGQGYAAWGEPETRRVETFAGMDAAAAVSRLEDMLAA